MRKISVTDAATIIAERGKSGRCLTALAGPPAAGKSTAADALAKAVNVVRPGSAAILPMDGYHFDDAVLIKRGLRSRKGAPETFDVGGLAAMLERLKANNEEEVAVPVFDRDLEIARAGARIIPREVRHVIVEGNYLLLDRHPWRSLASLFDTKISIETSMEELRRRLHARWSSYGLTKEAILQKVEQNDLPNARLVAAESIEPEFQLSVVLES